MRIPCNRKYSYQIRYTCSSNCSFLYTACSCDIAYIVYTVLPTPHVTVSLQPNYVSKLLEPLLPSSPASRILEVTRLKEFEDHFKENPRLFSWKTVAEVLYRCGHETLLNELFTYMKSPEGICMSFVLVCMSMAPS